MVAKVGVVLVVVVEIVVAIVVEVGVCGCLLFSVCDCCWRVVKGRGFGGNECCSGPVRL